MANVTSPDGKNVPDQESALSFTNLVERIRSFLKGRNGDASLRESLEDILEENEGNTQELRYEERIMLMNVLNLKEVRVEDVMVPRADIVAIESSATIADCARIFADAAHSRLPVYRQVLDDPIGMAHIKDLIGLLVPKGAKDAPVQDETQDPVQMPVEKLLRPILFVPPSMPVVDLFLKMQATRMHMALVIDEFGGTDGLVTIEDLVEEIVGDIEDEHDTALTPHLKVRPDGSYDASARVTIDELETAVALDLVGEDLEEDIETLGGLVFSLAGRVPQRGELIHHPAGLDFQVLDADSRRIKRLRIYYGKRQQPAAQEHSGAASLDSES